MKKKHPVLKAIGIILLILLLLLAIAVGAAYFFLDNMLDGIDRTEITGDPTLSEEEIYKEEPTVDATDSVEQIEEASQQYNEVQSMDMLAGANIDNILLIGSDRRSTKEYGRSDAMILVTLNYDTNHVHLTSLMRAMYVCIPRSSGDTWGMLNAAYSWGGPKLLVSTIENNFRIEIDHYVVVDFSSFEKAVNIVGGVQISLTDAEAYYTSLHSGVPTGSGTQTLNGAQALGYCRVRYTDNDFKRTERQRKVLTALMQKAVGSDVDTIMSLASEILPYVNTNLSNMEILGYVTKGLPLLLNGIDQRMLPIENEAGESYTGRIFVNGREMYKVDFETNIRALHEFMLS